MQREPAKRKGFIALQSVTDFKNIILVHFRVLSYEQEMALSYKQKNIHRALEGMTFHRTKTFPFSLADVTLS